MNRTVDSYTVRHRLTFTPDEVFAGLALLFPDTFSGLDKKKHIDIQFENGDVGLACVAITWEEACDSISSQIERPSKLVQSFIDANNETRSRYQKDDRVIISAYPGEGVEEGAVIEDHGYMIRISVDGIERQFVPGIVRLAT